MPLQFGMRGEHSPLITAFGQVRPGTLETISDLSDTARALIVMCCLPDDRGGMVWRFFDNTTDTDGEIYLIPAELIVDDNVIANIELGGYFERRIVTVAHQTGILCIQHVPTL